VSEHFEIVNVDPAIPTFDLANYLVGHWPSGFGQESGKVSVLQALMQADAADVGGDAL